MNSGFWVSNRGVYLSITVFLSITVQKDGSWVRNASVSERIDPFTSVCQAKRKKSLKSNRSLVLTFNGPI